MKIYQVFGNTDFLFYIRIKDDIELENMTEQALRNWFFTEHNMTFREIGYSLTVKTF